MIFPHYDLEREVILKGHVHIAGVDEVGRGCLAGPVVAAAVILNPDCIPTGLNDSKKLSAATRERLDVEIRKVAVAFAIGVGEVDEIDTINILNASKNAMIRAVQALSPQPHFLLVDGNFSIQISIPQKWVIRGDQISASVAAASIVAKVYRDRFMAELDSQYPGYDFAKHKGYGSEHHRRCLQKKGMSAIHRKSFNWTPV